MPYFFAIKSGGFLVRKSIVCDIVNKLFTNSLNVCWQKHSKQRRKIQIQLSNSFPIKKITTLLVIEGA